MEIAQFVAKNWQGFLVVLGACAGVGSFFGGLIAGFMNRRQIRDVKESLWRSEAASVAVKDMMVKNGTPNPFEDYSTTHPESSNVYLRPGLLKAPKKK